jgi:hypothetical protein
MTARAFLIMLLCALLPACGGAGATRVEYRTVNVPVPAPCPDTATRDRIAAARPLPLRDQPRPADEVAARAAEREQLRRYEAPDQWADQAMLVINDCAGRAPLVVEQGGE